MQGNMFNYDCISSQPPPDELLWVGIEWLQVLCCTNSLYRLAKYIIYWNKDTRKGVYFV